MHILVFILLSLTTAASPPSDSHHCATMLATRWTDDHGNTFTLRVSGGGAVTLAPDNTTAAGWQTASGTLAGNALNVTFVRPSGARFAIFGDIYASCERISWGNAHGATHTQYDLCPLRVAQGACTVQTAHQRTVATACCRWQAVRPHIRKVTQSGDDRLFLRLHP